MKPKNIDTKRLFITCLLFTGIAFSSCEKYVDIDKAPNQLQVSDTYKADGTATSAILALYSNYYTTSSLGYFTYLGGIEADELQYYYASSSADLNEFQQTTVSTTNSTNLNYLWIYPYGIIGEANLAITGLTASTTLTPSVKSQLLGEAKFFRAFTYFNLVNYMGDVPLALTGDALTDAYLPRSSADSVWAQIISDLKDAESLLPSTYLATLKTRVNKYAATALLARAYLYKKDYANAVAEATKVISATDVTYSLPALSSAFLNTSTEVIFQIGTTTGASVFGSNFRASSATSVPNYVLYPNFIKSFETGDKRRSTWVDSVISGSTTYYKINKYQLYSASAGNEYNVILRLAEQYLIRAEAYAQLANISASQADLNAVRGRAGLGGTTATTQADLLTAIANERKVELFGEFSHRWFDLKRTGQVDAVIGALKSTWKTTNALTPIPQAQRLLNTSLTQNPGYPN